MAFEYDIKPSKNCTIIYFNGNLMDKSEAINLMGELNYLIENNNKHFVLNLNDLKHMNSSGIGVLISVLTKSRNIGGESIVCNIGKKINELLIITKLNSVFKIIETEKEAVAFFNIKDGI